jgi:hypothetical protein
MKYNDIRGSLNKYTNRSALSTEGLRQLIEEAIMGMDLVEGGLTPPTPDEFADALSPPTKITKNQPFSYVAEVAVYDALSGKKVGVGPEDLIQSDGHLRKANAKGAFTPWDKLALSVAYNAMRAALSKIGILNLLGSPKSRPTSTTAEVDLVTDKAEVHVKFNEEATKRNVRLIGIQRVQDRAEEIDRTLRPKTDSNELEAPPALSDDISKNSVANIWFNTLTEFFGLKGTAPEAQPGGALYQAIQLGKHIKKGELDNQRRTPEYKAASRGAEAGNEKDKKAKEEIKQAFNAVKEIYQNAIKNNWEAIQLALENKGWSESLKNIIAQRLIPTVTEKGSYDKEIVFVRLFHPTPKNPGMRASATVERFKFGNVNELEVKWHKGKCYVIMGGQRIMQIEIRMDGDRHPPQIKTGPNYVDSIISLSSESKTIDLSGWQRALQAAADTEQT